MPGSKQNYLLITIIGFLIGLFILPVLNNVKLPFLEVNLTSSALIIIGFVVFANIALWLTFLVARFFPLVFQLAKFAAVGTLNALLDFGILNILIALTGFTIGFWYAIFKAASFIIASINSYFWNRYWTFGAEGSANLKEFGQFFSISAIGFVLNVTAAAAIVNFVSHPVTISPERWGNVGAVAASFASLIWNFWGYKFIVFKK